MGRYIWCPNIAYIAWIQACFQHGVANLQRSQTFTKWKKRDKQKSPFLRRLKMQRKSSANLNLSIPQQSKYIRKVTTYFLNLGNSQYEIKLGQTHINQFILLQSTMIKYFRNKTIFNHILRYICKRQLSDFSPSSPEKLVSLCFDLFHVWSLQFPSSRQSTMLFSEIEELIEKSDDNEVEVIVFMASFVMQLVSCMQQNDYNIAQF